MNRRHLLTVALAVTALQAAGCGSSSASSSGSSASPTAASEPQATPSTSTGQPARSGPPVVRTTHSIYGQILSDRRGFALYRFTRDPKGLTTCYGACANRWPPYLVSSRPSGRGPGGGLLGAVRRRDGRLQVTYAGQPLYYYVGDRRPGQVLCQGAVEFGGTWFVIHAA